MEERTITEKTLKIGSILMFAMGFFALAVSILWIFVTEIMFVSDFLFYTGEEFSAYLAASPVYAEMYMITKKLVGFVMLATSLQFLFITKKGYETGEKWAWWALLITGGLFWGIFLGYRIYIGYIAISMMTFVVGLIIWLLAILIPFKDFFGK